jgi:hypothetical protein
MNCRLCDSETCSTICSDRGRSYWRCGKCGLIFVPEREHISLGAEKERYDLHRNTPDHEGYLRFLNELVSVILTQCPSPRRILDYGSGKEAVLTRLLKEKGCDSTAYDPLYNIGKDALGALGAYDAVVLCEVLEHLRDLKKELVNMKRAAGRTGIIFIRTRLYPPIGEFAGWWYKNDITHINFLSGQTLTTTAAMLGKNEVLSCGQDIFLFRNGPIAPRRGRTSQTGDCFSFGILHRKL